MHAEKFRHVEFDARWVIYVCRMAVPLCRNSNVFGFPGCLESGWLGSFVVLVTYESVVCKIIIDTGYEWSISIVDEDHCNIQSLSLVLTK